MTENKHLEVPQLAVFHYDICTDEADDSQFNRHCLGHEECYFESDNIPGCGCAQENEENKMSDFDGEYRAQTPHEGGFEVEPEMGSSSLCASAELQKRAISTFPLSALSWSEVEQFSVFYRDNCLWHDPILSRVPVRNRLQLFSCCRYFDGLQGDVFEAEAPKLVRCHEEKVGP